MNPIELYREYTRLTHLKNGMNATSTDDQMQMLKSVLIKKRLAKDWNYLSEIIAEDFSNKNGNRKKVADLFIINKLTNY